MGAISGVICFDPLLDARDLGYHLCTKLQHRSPDGISRWHGPGASLACGYLRSTPEYRTDTQPLRLGADRVLVIDGMVDNRAEVIRALDLRGSAEALDDAQLLAKCWEAWGESLWTRVLGEYAIAEWSTTKRTLTLVRDRLGARPICYARTPGFFAFASETEALLGLPGVPLAPNMLRVATLWHGDVDPDTLETTLYEGIRKVPPASVMRVSSERTDNHRYWQMEPLPELKLRDDGEYVAAFQETFAKAVHAKARSIATPALMLSGGIDSASVLAALRGFNPGAHCERLLAISMVADGDASGHYRQETANIRAALAGHRQFVELPIPALSGFVTAADLAEVAWASAHPTDASLLLPAMVYLAASRSGSNVVLDGIDGDVVASSSPNYIAELIRNGFIFGALDEAKAASANHTYLQGSRPSKLIARGLLRAFAPASLLKVRHRARQSIDARNLDLSPLRSEEVARLGLAERLRSRAYRVTDEKLRRCRSWSEAIPAAQEAMGRVASRFGVEARHPWADQRVVDFFRQMPQSQLVRRGWTKYLIRSACEPALGASVAWHSGKAHLGPLLTRTLVGDTLPYLRDLIEGQRPALAAYFRGSFLDGIVAGLYINRLDDGVFCDSVRLIGTFARWLECMHASKFVRS